MGDADFLPAGRLGLFPAIRRGNRQGRPCGGRPSPAALGSPYLPARRADPPPGSDRSAGGVPVCAHRTLTPAPQGLPRCAAQLLPAGRLGFGARVRSRGPRGQEPGAEGLAPCRGLSPAESSLPHTAEPLGRRLARAALATAKARRKADIDRQMPGLDIWSGESFNWIFP